MKLNDWSTEELKEYRTVLEHRISLTRKNMKWHHSKLTKDIHNCTLDCLIGQSNKVARILTERGVINK